MQSFTLTCCSTADMPRSFFETRKIPLIYFHVIVNGETYPDDLGESLPFEKYYKMISDGAMPTTSQVNVEQFLEFFEPILQQGQDILHISFSSGLSGSYNSALVAKDTLLEKYPDRKIIVVDSLGASSGYGLLVTLLADKRDAGESIEDVAKWAEEHKLNIHHWFFSTDLTHYKRGGRISTASAIVGTMFNICPLMNMDDEGHLIPRTKYQGKVRVIKEIVNRMIEFADGGRDYSGKCYISNSACYDDARKVADLVEPPSPNWTARCSSTALAPSLAHTPAPAPWHCSLRAASGYTDNRAPGSRIGMGHWTVIHIE